MKVNIAAMWEVDPFKRNTFESISDRKPVANGKCTRAQIPLENTASPAVTQESLTILAVGYKRENKDVMVTGNT